MKARLLSYLATIGPVGFFRPAPGTWGSAFGVASGTAIACYHPMILMAGVVVLTVIGIVAAHHYQHQTGKKDASEVVVDEVAGQWIPICVIPLEWQWLLLAFILFRFFDIIKPGPVGMAEHWPGGYGVMADDVIAGAIAAIILIIAQVGTGLW